MMRAGCVKTSKSRPRITATSVKPQASAVRTASAVGAEMAAMTDAPMRAAFCTSSTETRLVISTTPEDPAIALPRQRARELVERIVASNILAHDQRSGRRIPKGGGVHRARLLVELLRGGQTVHGVDQGRGGHAQGAFQHRQIARGLFEALYAAQAAAGRPGHRAPPRGILPLPLARQPATQFDPELGGDDFDIERRPYPLSISPSVSAKPTAKSSRSAGVAIMTA